MKNGSAFPVVRHFKEAGCPLQTPRGGTEPRIRQYNRQKNACYIVFCPTIFLRCKYIELPLTGVFTFSKNDNMF